MRLLYRLASIARWVVRRKRAEQGLAHVAAFVPAWRASHVSPLEALRHD
jgi:hypothetical protein